MTTISISGDKFHVDGAPTHEGRTFEGASIEGTLFNTRMVQAIFDDANPETVSRWAYPDTGAWDAERNVSEFIAALPTYRAHGIDAVTINLQGGMPVYRTESDQPWENSAFTPAGELKADYFDRVRRVIDACDAQGIVVIVGYFYNSQCRVLADEAAIFAATENATKWLLSTGRENILVEIANEIDVPRFEHDVLTPGRAHELIACVQGIEQDGRRLLVSTSFTWVPVAKDAGINRGPDDGGVEFFMKMATASLSDIVRLSDFTLVHTNNLNAEEAKAIIAAVKKLPGVAARPRPVLVNEDGISVANLDAAASEGVGWGYYDQGHRNDYVEGFQSPPVNWTLSTAEKRAFFGRVKQITGA